MKTTSPATLAERTLKACAGTNLPELAELAAAVDAARVATQQRDDAAAVVPVAEEAIAAAKRAWGDDQTPERWRDVDQAVVRADIARARLEVTTEAQARAEEAIAPALDAALAAERLHIGDTFEARASKALAAYVNLARELESAARTIAVVVSDTRAQSDDLTARLRDAGIVDALSARAPRDIRLNSTPGQLAATAVAECLGGRARDCLHAESPLDHLTGTAGRGSEMEQRAIAEALRTVAAPPVPSWRRWLDERLPDPARASKPEAM